MLLVLGSGLGEVADLVEEGVRIPFSEIPGLPAVSVAGHPGAFLSGTLAGTHILVQLGRLHLYEGHAPAVVTASVRLAAAAGVRTAIFTNAAGAINRLLERGDILLIADHINLSWNNPLLGPLVPGDPRFPDMSEPYDRSLQELALAAARHLHLPLQRGVYAGVTGPSYETPAEIRMLRRLGADAVGMSTVAEVIVARACELRVLAFSLITNRAAGLAGGTLSHADVLEAARRGAGLLARLLQEVVKRMSDESG